MNIGLKLKLSKEYSGIIVTTAAILVVLLLFWLFVYSPARKDMLRVKNDLDGIRSEIKRIEALAGESGSYEEVYKKLHNKYEDLKKRFPVEERTTLSLLSSKADKMGIEVISMTPGKGAKSGISGAIEGRGLLEMPVEMVISCDYVTLGEYIDIIEKEIPTLININGINAKRKTRGDPVLNIVLNITLYMLD